MRNNTEVNGGEVTNNILRWTNNLVLATYLDYVPLELPKIWYMLRSSSRHYLLLIWIGALLVLGPTEQLYAQYDSIFHDKLEEGDAWLAKRDTEGAFLRYSEILTLSRQAKDICWESVANRRLADWAQKTNSLAKAADYAQVSIKLAKECGDSTDIVRSMMQAGGVNFRRNAYESALRYFLEASQIATLLKSDKLNLPAIFYCGQIYLNQSKYLDAIRFFKEGLSMLTIEDNSKEAANFMAILVRAYGQAYVNSELDSLQKGLEYYDLAVDYPPVVNNPSLVNALRIYLAEYYYPLIGIERALSVTQQVLDDPTVSARKKAYAHKIASDLWLENENGPEAVAHARSALSLAKQTKLTDLKRSAYASLHHALALNGDFKRAYEAFKAFRSLEDTLLLERADNRVLDLQVQYKTEKLAQEQEILEKKNELLQSRSRLGTIISLLLGSILVLGVWAFVRLRKKNSIILEQQASLIRANEAKDQLFAIIAHDLRGPFISFQGLTQKLRYLQQKQRPEALEKVTTHIEQTSRHLNNLLDNLLAWAIKQRDGQPYEAMMVDINSAVDAQYKDFAPALESKDIKFEVQIDSDAKAWVAQPVLATILRNLISNAVKFSPLESTISISTTTSGKQLDLRVTNEGSGVPEEFWDSLFELDLEKRQQGSKGEKGVGLGLSLCKELALASAGDLILDTSFKEGASFVLTLPLQAEFQTE